MQAERRRPGKRVLVLFLVDFVSYLPSTPFFSLSILSEA